MCINREHFFDPNKCSYYVLAMFLCSIYVLVLFDIQLIIEYTIYMIKIILKINKLLFINPPKNFFYRWIYFLKLKFYLYKLKKHNKKLASDNKKWASYKVKI